MRPPILHGGSLAAFRALFPAAPEPLVDLSTGINPHAYPMPDLPAACFTRLPEPGALAELEAVAASAYGVARAGLVVAAPGTQILIGLLPRLWPARRVAVIGPTYAEHAAAWRAAGHEVAETASLDEVSAETVVLCNPNNPDGRRLPPATLLAWATRLASRGGVLVVDEAFADFEPALSVAPALPHPGLVVLRSFGKAYGLAGVRLGFAVASGEVTDRLRAVLGPWPLSGVALAAGRAGLGDTGWREAQAAALAARAARLDAILTGAGMEVVGGTVLFRLGRHGRAPELFARLGEAGVLVRRFAGRPDWLRFGIPPSEEAFTRLARALGGAA